jgi:hypothetical protein
MTMTAGGAGYAGGPYRKRVLLEIEHAGALRAGTRPRGAPAVTPGPFGRKIKDQPNGAVVTPVRRARLAVGSHEAPSACCNAMRVSSTRDVMSSLRNTWRRWNATVCVLMNS